MGQGEQGKIGKTGLTGPTGETGTRGPIGLTGTMGPIGLTGTMGPIGLTGPSGSVVWSSFDETTKTDLITRLKTYPEFKGLTGTMGPIGLTGTMGPIGLTGTMGSIGNTGTMGPRGTIDTTKTMWCADGQLCKLPPTLQKIDIPKNADLMFDKSSISDDGQLRIVTDDKIYLTTTNSTGNIFINQRGAIQFGNNIPGGREENAGKITYGRFDQPDFLHIVGGGKTSGQRTVRVWDKLIVGGTGKDKDIVEELNKLEIKLDTRLDKIETDLKKIDFSKSKATFK